MHNKLIRILTIALAALTSTSLYAQNSIGYWYDSSNELVRTGYDECWRTSLWAQDNALKECEGEMKKPATVAAADSDNDGVIDSKDQCKTTAQGIKVDSMGCALDSDGDGIIDSNDSCAGTTKGTVVDNSGCALKADISLNNVQFTTGTANLNAASQNILDNVANVLLENTHLNFEVAGHTDNTGNYQNNVNLSANRASSVKQYLVAKGISESRLTSKGYGPDKPVATNDTQAGRKENRRVELTLK